MYSDRDAHFSLKYWLSVGINLEKIPSAAYPHGSFGLINSLKSLPIFKKPNPHYFLCPHGYVIIEIHAFPSPNEWALQSLLLSFM